MSQRMVKARKDHKCTECRKPIKAGEKYEYVFGVWDEVETFKTCCRCVAVREYVEAHVPCFCWAYGAMLSEARDAIYYAAPEVPGMGMEFGRLYVAAIKRLEVTA